MRGKIITLNNMIEKNLDHFDGGKQALSLKHMIFPIDYNIIHKEIIESSQCYSYLRVNWTVFSLGKSF